MEDPEIEGERLKAIPVIYWTERQASFIKFSKESQPISLNKYKILIFMDKLVD